MTSPLQSSTSSPATPCEEKKTPIEKNPSTSSSGTSLTPVTSIPHSPVVPALDLSARLGEVSIRVMREISQDTERRMQGAAADLKLLSEGVYYANDYCALLQKLGKGCETRYQWLRDKGHFFHGIAPKAYFAGVENISMLTGKTPTNYKLIKDPASKALAALRQGLSFLDCGSVVHLSHYEAVKDALGEDKFDRLFGLASASPFRTGDSFDNPITKLLKISKGKIQKGEQCYIAGVVTAYQNKHDNGEAAGYHVVACESVKGTQKFLGFGLPSSGATLGEIREILRQEFNKTPIKASEILREDLAKKCDAYRKLDAETIEEFNACQFSSKQFEKLGGGVIQQRMGLNLHRISQLASASIEEAAKLFDSWAGGILRA